MKDTQQDICKITGKAPVTERKMEKKFQWCQLCFEITNEINKTQLFLKTSINQIFSAQTNKYSVNIFLFFLLIYSYQITLQIILKKEKEKTYYNTCLFFGLQHRIT